jgi:ribosomal protein L37AE/L43A
VTAADPGPAPERAIAFYCPYCGDEDLRPAGADTGSWQCRSCTRRFALRLIPAGGAS